MPDEWNSYRLEEVCDFINGFAYKSTDYVPPSNDTIEVLRMGYIERGGGFKEDDSPVFVPRKYGRDLTKFFLQTGDIAIAMTDMKDRVAILANTAWIREAGRFALNQRVGCIRVKRRDLVNARFLYFYSNWQPHVDYLRSRANSGVQVNLSTSAITQSEIPLPPLAEQRGIAAVLGALDDKIELNRRMNETLEALAQSLFKSWFVDATQSALPKGWRNAAISELCEINSWTLGKGDELDRIEYVEISEVMRGNIANIQSYARGEEPSRARRRLRHGDTVLSTVRPDRGAYFLCLNPSPSLIGSTGFAVLTPIKAPWSFIQAAMTQADVFEYLGQQADGGAYPAVRPEIIGALEVPLPNKPELVEEFHRTCAPLYERAENNRQESRTLAALRDALLPKLLSGELRVPASLKN